MPKTKTRLLPAEATVIATSNAVKVVPSIQTVEVKYRYPQRLSTMQIPICRIQWQSLQSNVRLPPEVATVIATADTETVAPSTQSSNSQ